MTDSGPIDPATDDARLEKSADARKTRGIRFSDSEWEDVKAAAERLDVPAAEFVRETILGIARGRGSLEAGAIPPGLAPLIERTFRYTYMLATLKRDELVQDGRSDEIERLVETARKLQDSLREGGSE